MPLEHKKIPTGVSDFDTIVNGGLPAGSVVLLLGNVGAGIREYVYTSSSKLMLAREYPEAKHYYLGHSCDGVKIPDKIHYVTFSRSKEDIIQEVGLSFNTDFYEVFRDLIHFKDFSESYFKNSTVPSSWAHGEEGFGFLAKKEKDEKLLESLVNFLDENAKDSIVIIDSLTDLVVSNTIEMPDLVVTLKGLQRVAKKWNGIIYLLLTLDILDQKKQQMLIDSVDGVLVFEWSKSLRSSKRQRYMYVEKFMSILPHLDQKKIARFATLVTSQSGFIVINYERV